MIYRFLLAGKAAIPWFPSIFLELFRFSFFLLSVLPFPFLSALFLTYLHLFSLFLEIIGSSCVCFSFVTVYSINTFAHLYQVTFFFFRSSHAFINHLLSAIEMDAHHNKIIPFHISYQPYPLILPVIWNNVPFSSWSKRFLSLTDSSEWPLMSSIE